ncbi:MAG TPA: M14 metallopeptidase family protein [Gemmatimonadales bacterium]|nr:M14 metallopeptidase family protein [Gemmatimonadales bacterium]
MPFPLATAARLLPAALLLCPALPLAAQSRVTSPKEQFGAALGDDYFLANYQQIAAYWRKLASESDRIVLRELGKTAEGRPQLMAIVTAPENQQRLARYQEISRRLANAGGLGEEEARALAREGKAVVWIDGGLHATEVLGAQQLAEMVYRMVSGQDEETLRILRDVIILFVHANPDGNDLVADWYMRNPVPERRTLSGLPRLYQKYIGHDNNRDFFASTQAETENINRALYHQWFPQILYNHHQSGPAGTVVYSPPLRDPYNFNLDPVLILGLQSLGAAMHTRLALEGKGGATMRSGGPYDGWWNGGIRNTATFHNTIAMLTEMIGSPTPVRIPFIAARQVPGGDLALPVAPQEWHFRQSIEYSVSLDRAVLDYASRMRESLLYNIYAMGRASIARGSTDSWTANPRRIAELTGGPGARGGDRAADSTAWAVLHRPELRDPRGFILPSDQPDFPTAVKFVNALRETGITVQRATADFSVAGKRYPAGSLLVFTAQAFRPHVMDMFEPQAHPDVFPYPGAPPTPPYDIAGWTLAYQMGVQFDRILDGFSGPFAPVEDWNLAPPPGRVTRPGASGFLLSRRVNNGFIAINRLLAAGAAVAELTEPLSEAGTSWAAGTWYVPANAAARRTMAAAARELGVSFAGTSRRPARLAAVRAPRVGLWDQYGGSIDAGWARWILEQFEFPFERVFAPALDAGQLNAKYDVLVFVGGGIPGASGATGGGGGAAAATSEPPDLPAEYRGQFGRTSVAKTLPRLREFLEQGGTVIAIGSSAANLAAGLELPLLSQLVADGAPLPHTKFFVPGSVLSVRVDASQPAAFGMSEHTDIFFDDSPVFKLGTGATASTVRRIAWYDSRHPLRSGWAWGQEVLDGGIAAAEVPVGKGRVLLFAPEILQRAQPHGSFKLLFNGLFESTAR